MPALKSVPCRCLHCGRPYMAAPCRLRLGYNLHCSRRCANKSPLRYQLTKRDRKAGYANAPSRIKSRIRSLYRAGKIKPGTDELDRIALSAHCLTAVAVAKSDDDLEF